MSTNRVDLMDLYPYAEGKTLVEILRPHIGKNVKSYSPPTKAVIQNFSGLLNALEEEDAIKVEEFANKLKMGAAKFKFLDNVIMFYPKQKTTVAVTFLWRVGKMKIPGDTSTRDFPVDPLILEGPHEGKDGTISSTTNHFALTKARILLINAVHPRESDKEPQCQKGRNISDAAHCTDTLFHRVHSQLTQLYPFAFYVQIHGMKPHKNMHILVVNSYGSYFTRDMKSGPTLFAQTLPEFFNLEQCRTFSICSNVPGEAFGKQLTVSNKPENGVFRRPKGCHNTNVQGHQLNGGGQCSVGKKDTGRFMHIELDPTAKGKWNDKLAETLNKTMEKWNEMPPEKVDDIVEADDDFVNEEDSIVVEDENEKEDDDSIAGPDEVDEEQSDDDDEEQSDDGDDDDDVIEIEVEIDVDEDEDDDDDDDEDCCSDCDDCDDCRDKFTNDELELMLMMLNMMKKRVENKIEKM